MSELPMMAEAEIEIINNIIKEVRPQFCLEWGSGRSTEYFPRQHPGIQLWLAIEHNGHWVQRIASNLPNNAQVIWVPTNEWYIDCIKHSRKFDFILVDGLHREDCLHIARQILTEKGVILLHDAGRAEYKHFIISNHGEMLIDGEIPQKDGGFAHRGIAKFGAKE